MNSMGYFITGVVLLSTSMVWFPISGYLVIVHMTVGISSMGHAIFGNHDGKNNKI